MAQNRIRKQRAYSAALQLAVKYSTANGWQGSSKEVEVREVITCNFHSRPADFCGICSYASELKSETLLMQRMRTQLNVH